jgi:hypothetical protein
LSIVDILGISLIIVSGILTLFPSFLDFNHELIPLVIGISILLVKNGRKEPILIAYLCLLLLSMRIYLHSDERYLGWEITLSDYIMIVIAFSAFYKMAASLWTYFFTFYALAMPLAGIVALHLFLISQSEESFQAAALSINQTAFLFGGCLTISSSFLLCEVYSVRARARRVSVIILWTLSTLLSSILVLNTQSRAAIGLPVISIAVVLFACMRSRSVDFNNRLNSLLNKAKNIFGRYSAYIVVIVLALSALAAMLTAIYSNRENMVNDMHRLHLLKCYFGALFNGNNSFIYGLGFTRASQGICKDIGLIKGTTHAHNVFAQVAADNGFPALLMICIIGFLLIRLACNQIPYSSHPAVLASLTLSLYCFLFLLIEGGWGKVSFIQSLLGLSFASLTMKLSPQVKC